MQQSTKFAPDMPAGRLGGPCPKCGQPLVLRHRHADLRRFWGCSEYPGCRFTKPFTQTGEQLSLHFQDRTTQYEDNVQPEYVRYLEERVGTVQQENACLKELNRQLEINTQVCRNMYTKLQDDYLRLSHRQTDSATLDRELKRLLLLTHPDRWAQGQSALELAHETTTTINGLRERLAKGHA